MQWDERRNKISRNFCRICCISIVDKSRIKYETNGVETTVDSDGVLWLNEQLIEERLDHKNMRVTTVQYLFYHRKHRYELIDEQKNSPT